MPFIVAPKKIKYWGINLKKKGEGSVCWKLQNVDEGNQRSK